MFTRVFGKPKQDTSSNALATLDKLNEVFYFHMLCCVCMCISKINQFNYLTWFSYDEIL